MKTLLIAAALLAGTSMTFAGERTTGNFCTFTQSGSQNEGYCYGEIIGAVETAIELGVVALPPGVNDVQIISMTRAFMNRHPELTNRSIHALALMAMGEAGWRK